MAIKSIELEDKGVRYNLYFKQEAYDKMRLYVELCPDEIGWLGYVDKLNNNLGYLVTDVFLVEQDVHGTTTELTPEGMMKYYSELPDEEKEIYFQKCRLWGHSHVNMGVSPSGQDETQGEVLSKDMNDYFIRLITNKRGEYNITFYDKVIKAKIVTDQMMVYNPEASKLREMVQAEIKEKVKKLVPKTVYNNTPAKTNTYSNYNRFKEHNKKNKTIYTSTNNHFQKLNYKKDGAVEKINIKDLLNKIDYSKSFVRDLEV